MLKIMVIKDKLLGRDRMRAGYPQHDAFSTLLPDDFETSSIVNCSAMVGCTPTVSSRS